ncbi:hypothetical protein O1611_g7737 [Lasiodiplodia mahajangana]|uniref:Uncharacterized protein n=1 Tax=Lasiodiplodia mahajangana TaxID=1108764 RepID=A0ACC2JEK3_9PEZI|nr:hypothetical protein O1611_g7737 [Lasiodiplodia mahajangana]
MPTQVDTSHNDDDADNQRSIVAPSGETEGRPWPVSSATLRQAANSCLASTLRKAEFPVDYLKAYVKICKKYSPDSLRQVARILSDSRYCSRQSWLGARCRDKGPKTAYLIKQTNRPCVKENASWTDIN